MKLHKIQIDEDFEDDGLCSITFWFEDVPPRYKPYVGMNSRVQAVFTLSILIKYMDLKPETSNIHLRTDD